MLKRLDMEIQCFDDPRELAVSAAAYGAERIRRAVESRGEATIVVATGNSQIRVLAELVDRTVPWHLVTAFHLDEYVGLPVSHRASFRAYLRNRFVSKVPRLQQFHEIDGEADPSVECRRLGRLIDMRRIDVLFAGIGENGHLAFNDPPGDFETRDAYIVVNLDEACRMQQVGEGWFDSVRDVPRQAISMSISRIMDAACIVASVPDLRKAQAVKQTIEGPIGPECPASILRRHRDCRLLLDRDSASLTSILPTRGQEAT